MIQLFSNEFKIKPQYIGDFKVFINSVGLFFEHNINKNTYFIYGTSENYQALYNLDTQVYNIEFNKEDIDLYTDEDNLKATINFTWFLSQVVDSLAIYYEFDTETQRIIATRINDNNCIVRYFNGYV